MPEPLSYEEKKVVGRFRVLAGRHSEGGRDYGPNDVVESKSDLRLMNSPGAKKFEEEGPIDEAAIRHNCAGQPRPTYIPENPNTLPPEQKREFDRSGRVPVQTGRGDEDALAAGGTVSDEELNLMTDHDLRELAEDEEIDMAGVKTRQEAVDRVRQARRGTTTASGERPTQPSPIIAPPVSAPPVEQSKPQQPAVSPQPQQPKNQPKK